MDARETAGLLGLLSLFYAISLQNWVSAALGIVLLLWYILTK